MLQNFQQTSHDNVTTLQAVITPENIEATRVAVAATVAFMAGIFQVCQSFIFKVLRFYFLKDLIGIRIESKVYNEVKLYNIV